MGNHVLTSTQEQINQKHENQNDKTNQEEDKQNQFEQILGRFTLINCVQVTQSKKKPFIKYLFEFTLNDQKHCFATRYSSLYNLHQKLVKDGIDNVPIFPPKNIMTNYLKEENYKHRGKELLIYLNFVLHKCPDIM
eukprot:512746_1